MSCIFPTPLTGIFQVTACALLVMAGSVRAEDKGNLLNDGQPIGTSAEAPAGWKPSTHSAEWVAHPSKPDQHVFLLSGGASINVYWSCANIPLGNAKELELSWKWRTEMIKGNAICSIRWFADEGEKSNKPMAQKDFVSADSSEEFIEEKHLIPVPDGAVKAQIIYKFNPNTEGTFWVESPLLVPVN